MSTTSNVFTMCAVLLAACGSSSPAHPDAAVGVDASGSTGAVACAAVGSSYCERMYSCYTAAQIQQFQLPATQAECVTQANADCGAAIPAPGYCKGHAQTTAAAATACAAELDAMTCAALMQPSNGVCKTQLCSN